MEAQNKAAEEVKNAPPKKQGFLDKLFGKKQPKAGDKNPSKPPQVRQN